MKISILKHFKPYISITFHKTILLIALFAITYFGYSQNVNTSLASDINQKFSLLEKNRIPNHILIDMALTLLMLPNLMVCYEAIII